MLRCLSPIGEASWELDLDGLGRAVLRMPAQVVVERDDRKQMWTLRTEDECLLAAPEHDRARVAWLVRRVTLVADELEAKLLPGQDEPLDSFRLQLDNEADRAD